MNTGAEAAALANGQRAELLKQFRVVLQAIKSHFTSVERTTGIGGAKVWALSLVDAQPGIGVTELAKAMSVRQPTASQMVKQLHLQGYLEARPHPTDRRAVQLHLSSNGRTLLDKAPQPHAGVLPQAIEQLDEETVGRLLHDLHQLAKAMGASETAATTTLDKL